MRSGLRPLTRRGAFGPRRPARRWRAALALGLLALCATGVQAQTDVTVALTSPSAGQTVLGDVEVRGTARGPNFSRYELYFRAADSDQEYIYFNGGQAAVASGVLGSWSSRGQAPGDYEILLRAIFADQQDVETSVRFSLAPDAADPGAAPESRTGNGSVAPAGDGPALTDSSALRVALDGLAARARPPALQAYILRGMRFSALLTAWVLGYFGLKAVVGWIRRRGAKAAAR